MLTVALGLFVLAVVVEFYFKRFTSAAKNMYIGNMPNTTGEEFAYEILTKSGVASVSCIYTSNFLEDDEAYMHAQDLTNNKIFCNNRLRVSNEIRHVFTLAHEAFHVVQNKTGKLNEIFIIRHVLNLTMLVTLVPCVIVSLYTGNLGGVWLIPLILLSLNEVIIIAVEGDCNLRALKYIKPKISVEEYGKVRLLAFSYWLGYAKFFLFISALFTIILFKTIN